MSDSIYLSTDQRQFVMVYHDFLTSNRLTVNEKMVFIFLKKYAGSDGNCFPSIDQLAKDCGITKRTMFKIIKSLENKGVILKTIRTDPQKGYLSNFYKLYDHAEMWKTQKKGPVNAPEQSAKQNQQIQPENDNTLNVVNCQHDKITRNYLDQKFDYQNVLLIDYESCIEDFDVLIELILEILNSDDNATFRINKHDLSAEIVKGRFLKLNYCHLIYIVNQIGSVKNLVKRRRNYLLTCLFNSYTDLNLQSNIQYNIDQK